MLLRLNLADWMNHRALDLATTRPVTIVTGANASGKSALADAVEFAFLGTGKLRGIGTKRDLARLSITDDARATRVDVTLEDFGISRRMGDDAEQDVTIDERVYKVGAGDAKILELLGLDARQIRAALGAEHVLTGSPSERRSVFFAATGSVATTAEIRTALEERGLEGDDAKKLASIAGEEGLGAALEHAATERAARTRILRDGVAAEPERTFAPSWSETPFDLGTIEIESLRRRQSDLERLIGEADEQTGADRGRLEEALESARSARQALVDRGEVLAAQEGDRAALQEVVTETADAIDAARQQVADASTRIGTLRGEQQQLIDGSIERPEVCPVIPGRPKCPMTQKKMDAIVAKAAGRLASIEKEIPQAKSVREGYEAEVAALDGELRSARAGLEEEERTAKELTQVHADLDVAEETLGAAQVAFDAVAEAPEPVTAEDRSAAWYRQRLERLRTVLEAKRAYDGEAMRHAGSAELRVTAESERAWWDRAAKALAPDGIPRDLFLARTAPLQGYVDEIAAGWASVRLTDDAELEAEVNGRWRRYAQLSESWRLRLAVVASHLIARAAGFPLLVVDRFDHLDPEGRLGLLRGLVRVAEHYPGGVLVLATLSRQAPAPTGLPEVETVWLRPDGTLERVG